MSFANPTSRHRFSTIGARLTLWGAVVTFGTCALLCAALYAGVSMTLRQEIDSFLGGEVHEFLSSANHHQGDDSSLEQSFRRELGARALGDLAFRMFGAEGQLLVSSEKDDVVAKAWKPAPLGQYLFPFFETVWIPEAGHSYRLCSLRATLEDGRVVVGQASYSLVRMTESLAYFRRICATALVASVLIAFGIGRFLATRSLRPIRMITAKARRIGADQLDRRLPVRGSGDELDQLILTLNELLARIERYVSQLRQFTADASHELRTPLAALRGATEVALLREHSAEGLRRVLEDNIGHFERLQRIAEDLLLLSRLDAGERILKREDVDLRDAVLSTVDLYRPVAEEHAIQLSAGNPPSIRVVGDTGRIRQVLSNLLDNAIKYTPENGQVSVELAQENGHARVCVRDTGIGIGHEDLLHVFDRFFRADRARSARNGIGSGLGLTICRSIMSAHGGDIHVQSNLGRGTTVTVILPLVDKSSHGS